MMHRLLVLLTLLLTAPHLEAGDPRWVVLDNVPSSRQGHAAVQVHTGDVVVFGGVSPTGSIAADSWVLRAVDGRRDRTLNAIPIPVCFPATVVVPSATGESVVYAIGGYTIGGGAYASTNAISILRYNTAQDNWQWTSAGTLPVAVAECRAVFDGDRSIVVSGGYEQTTGARASGARSRMACIIDVVTGNVTRIDDHQTGRAAHGAFLFEDQAGTPTVMVAAGEATTPATELLAGTTWDPRANAPLALRKNVVPVSDIQRVARMFGGESGNGTPLASCEWYDPKSGWRTAPPMSAARTDASGVLVAGSSDTASAYLVVAGQGPTAPHASTEIFFLPTQSDPAGSWTPFQALNSASRLRQVACFGNNLPVVVSGEATPSVEVFQPLQVADVGFPSTETGARSDSVVITIVNTWLLPVTIDSFYVDSPEFIAAAPFTSTTIPAGSSTSIIAWFRPSQAGPRTGTLTLDMGTIREPVQLSGNGLASTISTLTTAVDHGDVQVGDADTICLPLIRNEGSDTTFVDSIQILPPGADVRVLRPTGKTAVAPGEELEVCFVYRPTSRSVLSASALIHIGPRSYPVSVIGRGIRTTAVILADGTCDTVSAQRGDPVILSTVLENIGDRDVVVTAIDLQTSVPGIAQVIDPATLPITLAPGAREPLQIQLEIQREGQELIGVTCTSNSDSAMVADLCVVTAARSLQLSVSDIDVGTLCAGDVVRTSITVTNVSATETIIVDDVRVENTPQVTVVDAQPFMLPPRASRQFDVVIAAVQPGPLNGRLVFDTPTGSSVITVTGTVGEAIQLDLADIAVRPGATTTVPLTITDLQADRIAFILHHGLSEINLVRIESVAGMPQVHAATALQRTPVGTDVSLVLQTPAAGVPIVVNLVVEGLRARDQRTTMIGRSPTPPDVCISSDTASVVVSDTCGTYGGVAIGSGAALAIAPSIISTTMELDVIATQPDAFTLQVVDVNGHIVHQASITITTALTRHHLTHPVHNLASGMYSLRLVSSRGIEDTQLIMVQR